MSHFIPAQFLTEIDFKAYAHNLIERILLFSDLLRKNRVPVHTAKELDAIAALQYVDISKLSEFYMTLKATMLVSNKHFSIFDQLFAQFWSGGGDASMPGDDTSGETVSKQNTIEKQSGPEEGANECQESVNDRNDSQESEKVQLQSDNKSDNREQDDSAEETLLPTYSLVETLREKDFEDIHPSEFVEFEELFKWLRITEKEKLGRRFKPSKKGRIIDLPKSIRQSRQKGGEIIKIFTKDRKPRHSKLVLIADVSASMDIYSTFLIKFIYELQKYLRDAETFVFGTQLKRITDILCHRSIGTVLSLLSQSVLFWSGGTNIGGSFRDFNSFHGGKLRKRNRILVILSDGWDTGDIETLKKQMVIFKKGFKKIVWLNPNLKYDSYQPLCMGMSAAMPYIDYFLPCHNLKTLEAFIDIVKKI